jgi:galactose mutarotase-like enzyme
VLSIGTDRLDLEVSPDFGARVVALTDRTTGRQWLVTGPQSHHSGEDAAFGAEEAVGWDECFPTVLACNHPAWPSPLRDHGALWGRKWVVDQASSDRIETRFETAQFRFSRQLSAVGASVTAEYRVTNLGMGPLPYLWSQHCLLATGPGDRIDLSGHESLRAGKDRFSWPDHPIRNLSLVGSIGDDFALKAYSETPRSASAAVMGPNGGLSLNWDDVPAFGLWLCYGGWPEGNRVHQVALEPTTAPADDLVTADAAGQARRLAQGETHNWSVRMTLTNPEEGTLQ